MTVVDYIKKTTGLEVTLGNLCSEVKKGLPLYLRKSDYQEIFIEGKRVILDVNKSFTGYTPDYIAKQKEILERYFSATVVYCFVEIESYQRKRLIEKKVAFIQQNRQMYIPSLLLDLKEFGTSTVVRKEKLGAISQVLVLFHLQKQSIENIPLGQITKLLPYSAMSISRAADELVTKGICQLSGNKTKVIKFLYDKKELWGLSLPFLRLPVKKIVYDDVLPESISLMKSGEVALEHYSNLLSDANSIYAISIQQYQDMKKLKVIPDMNLHDGKYSFEIWNYDPKLLSDGNFVDPLSLYLAFMNNEDERIQMSLDELIGNVKW